jgi:hypothetical protein
MSKNLILEMALSLLLVSGSFFSAQAACDLSSHRCPPHSSSCSLFGPHGAAKDADRDSVTKQESSATSKEPLKQDTDTK